MNNHAVENYSVANVKVSLKTSQISLDNVAHIAKENNLYFKCYKNFVVFKNKFTYVIFKTNKSFQNHINITKIRDLFFITEAVDLFKSIFTCEVKKITVDNIIATTEINNFIDLSILQDQIKFHFIHLDFKVKYNSEVFPGLFIKTLFGTIIFFKSGKIVLVGSKSKGDIEWLMQKIYVLITK